VKKTLMFPLFVAMLCVGALSVAVRNPTLADTSAVASDGHCAGSVPGDAGVAPDIHPQASPIPAHNKDYVIVTGDTLPAFKGVPVEQLFVYRYAGGTWQQIPWQFDQVISGNLTTTVTFPLDEDDQLVFMASDTGAQASSMSWIDDMDSQQYPRYEIALTDPLSPTQKAWIYVYRSATLSETVTTDYADFDPEQWIFTAEDYLLGIVPNKLIADRLEMNGSGIDILDRSKVRGTLEALDLHLTEDNFKLNDPAVRDGRVRAWGACHQGEGFDLILFGYRSAFQFAVDFDFTRVFSGLQTLDTLRLSADLSPTVVSSLYYDGNTPDGVPVDGQPDTVAATPAVDWWQVSGSSGTVVQIADLSALGGITRTNYYKDDATSKDPNDTGDGFSYSDCGIFIESPSAHVRFNLWYYILPPDQPSVGATYRDHALHPLQFAGEEQTYQPPHFVYLPLVLRNF